MQDISKGGINNWYREGAAGEQLTSLLGQLPRGRVVEARARVQRDRDEAIGMATKNQGRPLVPGSTLPWNVYQSVNEWEQVVWLTRLLAALDALLDS